MPKDMKNEELFKRVIEWVYIGRCIVVKQKATTPWQR